MKILSRESFENKMTKIQQMNLTRERCQEFDTDDEVQASKVPKQHHSFYDSDVTQLLSKTFKGNMEP